MEAGGDVPVAAANPGAHRFHFFASSLVNVSQSLGFSSPISCYPLLLIFVEFYLLLFLVFPFASHFRRERNATTRRERERETVLLAFASYPPPRKLLHSVQPAPQRRSRARRPERGHKLLPPHPASMEGESRAILPNRRIVSSFLL
jgi:hypothetical protein